jgi:hypothetical protein
MRQLCAADDLALLDAAPDHAQAVRFAPRAVRATFADRADPGGIAWISAGYVAGVVRLVPLRAGAAELAWPTADLDDSLL